MNSRRDFLVTAGILCSSVFMENITSRSIVFKSNGELINRNQILDAWFANNFQSPEAYLAECVAQSAIPEDLAHVVKNDFITQNTISYDGFVFSATEFAVLAIVSQTGELKS